MKRKILLSVAITSMLATPVFAQQQPLPDGFVPGENFLSIWDLDEDGAITLEELLERRGDVFATFDQDEDGTLSAEEFQALDEARIGSMQRPAGRGNGAGRAQNSLSAPALDTDKDGKISQEEYLNGTTDWMAMMDSDGDGTLTKGDFGPGARQKGMSQGRGNSQGMRQGQGMGQGQAPGRQGGKGQGMGRNRSSEMGQAQGQGRGRGQGGPMQMGSGRGMGQPAAQYNAFATDDGGLWVIDSRTGHILLCQSETRTDVDGGFVPVCKEAKF